jgi:hypothetical protein
MRTELIIWSFMHLKSLVDWLNKWSVFNLLHWQTNHKVVKWHREAHHQDRGIFALLPGCQWMSTPFMDLHIARSPYMNVITYRHNISMQQVKLLCHHWNNTLAWFESFGIIGVALVLQTPWI